MLFDLISNAALAPFSLGRMSIIRICGVKFNSREAVTVSAILRTVGKILGKRIFRIIFLGVFILHLIVAVYRMV